MTGSFLLLKRKRGGKKRTKKEGKKKKSPVECVEERPGAAACHPLCSGKEYVILERYVAFAYNIESGSQTPYCRIISNQAAGNVW